MEVKNKTPESSDKDADEDTHLGEMRQKKKQAMASTS